MQFLFGVLVIGLRKLRLCKYIHIHVDVYVCMFVHIYMYMV